jgi:hypothetical protein
MNLGRGEHLSVIADQPDPRPKPKGVSWRSNQPNGDPSVIGKRPILKCQKNVVVLRNDKIGDAVSVQIRDGQCFSVRGNNKS